MLEVPAPSRHAVRGPGRYRLLIVNVSFDDVAAPTDPGWASRTVAEMDAYFREVSRGHVRWELSGTRAVRFLKPSPAFHLMRRSLRDRVHFWRRLLDKLGAPSADAVLAVVPDSAVVRGCFAVGPRWNSPRLNAAVESLDGMRGAVIRASTAWGTIAHELGHILGLPDLYDYQAGRQSADYAASRFVGPWDLMGRVPEETAGARPHPMAWTKTLAGWIDPVDWTSGQDEYLLGPEHAAAVRVPVGEDVGLYIESRSWTGYDVVVPSEGVLVSLADERRSEGRGPLRVVRPAGEDAGWSVTLRPGDLLRQAGYCIRVLGRDGTRYTAEIARD